VKPRYEDAAARNARLNDNIKAALVMGVALIVMFVTTRENGWGPIAAVGAISFGVTSAVLDARRYGWDWSTSRWTLLFYVVLGIASYAVWRVFFR
jgi:hypothetical protein